MTPAARSASGQAPARSSLALHWLVAVGVIGMLALGFYVSSLPRGPLKTEWVQVHKSFGLIVFALALARIWWRVRVGFPASESTGLERAVARVSHALLLTTTVVMPLSGIVRSLSYARPVELFGWTLIPQLIAEKNETLNEIAGTVHDLVGWGLAALVALHVGAALKHHFVDRDDTLLRMTRIGPGAFRGAPR